MSFTFLRWLRTGMVASLEDVVQAPTSAERAKVSVGVEVEATDVPQSQVGTVNLDLLGPGDVTGIDPRQVIREFPARGTLDFEPGYFVHVEFDRPDLPWLFTPHGAMADGSLRPWLCLVVVKQGPQVTLKPTSGLPLLTVEGSEVTKLPELVDSNHPKHVHRWAHVQITGDTATGAEAITDSEPERILSRLVCPRVLDPDSSYLACVVPTFKIGALAGLDGMRQRPRSPPPGRPRIRRSSFPFTTIGSLALAEQATSARSSCGCSREATSRVSARATWT